MAVKTAGKTGGRARQKARRKSPPWWRWTKRIGALILLLILISASAIGLTIMLALRGAADRMGGLVGKIEEIDSPATKIYARDGKTLLYSASSEYRKLIRTYDEIPKTVVNATLAAEDKRFFEHSGVDPKAVFRSMIVNVRDGRQAQGGSTITMQLSKRLFTSTEKSLKRKIEDAANAIELEKKLTKKEILLAYLNQVYYGQGAYGIRAAADVYFGKRDLKQLTVGEAAMLARLVRRPSAENPIDNLDAAVHNRDVVLGIMRDEAMISKSEYDKAIAEKPKLRPRQFGSGERIYAAPYFTRYVVDQLHATYPGIDLGTAGWTVVTTLDPDLQAVAEEAVKDLVHKYRRRRVSTAAFVLLDNQGQILAMQGNLNWEKDQFNVITQGKRQPGSSFKPFVYFSALSTGAIRPGDQISNEPFIWRDPSTGKVWAPHNSGGGSGGVCSIVNAIQWSRNLPAVHVTQTVGPKVAAQYARDVFGFESEIHPWPSMALGTNEVSPLEMAQGYSVFQLHGNRFTPYGVVQILGPDKNIVRSNEPRIIRHIGDEGAAAYIDMCLRAVVDGGTGKGGRSIRDARGKTGTTQDAKDAWFCGYTNNLLGIGWISNVQYDKHGVAKYEPMSDSVFGGTVTVEMWTQVMRAAQKKRGYGTPAPGIPMTRSDMMADVEGTKKQAEPTTTEDTTPDPAIVGPDSGTDSKTVPPVNEPPVSDPDTPPVPPDNSNESRPPKADPPAEDMVEVDVCAETGQKATIYCPETVTRRFSRRDAPKRWCRKHSP